MANNSNTPTFKQRKFAKAYIENNGNASKAALEAYDTFPAQAKTIGYQALQKPIVQKTIQELLDKKGITLDYLSDEVKDAISFNLKEGKASQAVGADLLKFMFKLHNAIPASKQVKLSYSRSEKIASQDYKEITKELAKISQTTQKLLEDLS